jgi:2-iminobutanoate/2-iminopropanoate deaminase
MSKRSFYSDKLPKPVAPYCHAARAGGLMFLSGMLSQDPATGKLVLDDIQSQTRRILTNMRALLGDLSFEMTDVAKVTIFLTDMSQFKLVNEVYREFFAGEPPARSCVGVAALPLGALIEIEAIAGA